MIVDFECQRTKRRASAQTARLLGSPRALKQPLETEPALSPPFLSHPALFLCVLGVTNSTLPRRFPPLSLLRIPPIGEALERMRRDSSPLLVVRLMRSTRTDGFGLTPEQTNGQHGFGESRFFFSCLGG